MLSDYRRYLLNIRDSFIQNGVGLGIDPLLDYESVFYMTEKLDWLLWYFSVMKIGGNSNSLEGFMFPLNSFYMGRVRDKYFEDYLLYRAGYMDISVSDALKRESARNNALKLAEVVGSTHGVVNRNTEADIFSEHYLEEGSGVVNEVNAEKVTGGVSLKVESDDTGSGIKEAKKVSEVDKAVVAGVPVEDEDGFIVYTVDGTIEKPDMEIEEEITEDDTEDDAEGEDDFGNWGNHDGEDGEDDDDIYSDWGDDSDDVESDDEEEDDIFDDWGNSDGEDESEADDESSDGEDDEDIFSNWGNSDEDESDVGSDEVGDDEEDDIFSNWGSDSEDEDTSPEDEDEEDDIFDNWGNQDDEEDDSVEDGDEEDDEDIFGSWGSNSEDDEELPEDGEEDDEDDDIFGNWGNHDDDEEVEDEDNDDDDIFGSWGSHDDDEDDGFSVKNRSTLDESRRSGFSSRGGSREAGGGSVTSPVSKSKEDCDMERIDKTANAISKVANGLFSGGAKVKTKGVEIGSKVIERIKNMED